MLRYDWSQTWKETFDIDRYGNRRYDAANTTTIGCAAAVCNPTVNTANNRLSGYGYDATGNASTNALLTKNFYDGDGVRTKVEENGVTTIFVYDAFDKIIAEYTINAPSTVQKVSYLTNDLLGTPRLITDENRQVISRRDTTPFGEEIAVGIGGRTLGQQYNVSRIAVTETILPDPSYL